ncbi:MAG: hypothetical protein ACJA2F_000175, partial [Nitriliruptoraceae bacterium]
MVQAAANRIRALACQICDQVTVATSLPNGPPASPMACSSAIW